jgi:type II secretory pathway component PulK
MMNLGREDVMQMSMEEYEARLFHWNDAHKTGEASIETRDPAATIAELARINADPRLTH